MANESSFTGEVIFFHKRLSNTPENVRKFIKILDVFLELTNTYYGGFQEVTTDDMEFNKQADYVESISYYFFSCGRWTYENNLLGNYLLNDIQEDLCSIILKIVQEEYVKNNSSIDGIINLEDIDFLMIEDKDDKKLVLNYDNTDWYTIFQNIEKSIKKYIGSRGLKTCQITS